MKNEYTLTKYGCYLSGFSMSIVATLSPLLFVTFRELYGISYTLLGLLVVINFSTQLIVDLVFTFFSDKFNIQKTVCNMPLYTFFGLILYGVLPLLFPQFVYLWLSLGTVMFSVAAGLSEVLTSPVIAAIPSENPEGEMSKLHSMYAWGVVIVVIISTLYIKFFGQENWNYLAVFWSVVPLIMFFVFKNAKFPKMENEKMGEIKIKGMGTGLILFTICIFFGGAAECTMSQWASGFLENALNIPKVIGDIFGVALFSLLLGFGRTLYAKYGKNILNVMLWGMTGATVCYLFASLSQNVYVGLASCILTGFATAMLWPGTLILLGEKYPQAGVWVYALMASGGDMGASLGPQIVGIVSDNIGMREGILAASIFPLLGVVTLLIIKRYFMKKGQV